MSRKEFWKVKDYCDRPRGWSWQTEVRFSGVGGVGRVEGESDAALASENWQEFSCPHYTRCACQFKPTSAFCSRRCDILGMAAQRKATFEKGRFPEFAIGYYFYDTVLLSNFKIYIIFILPLLSIYFYFIAYHVGGIWLLNVWRIGPGGCFFSFILL